MIDHSFWKGRRVLVTGHTGFKGSWLCLWLHLLDAEVSGYALDPPTTPSLFDLARIGTLLHHDFRDDVRELVALTEVMNKVRPEIVIHMAAQPLVRDSYKIPVETYATNVMGTVNLLEAVRQVPSVRAVVNVTTDKVYENQEWDWGYRENEPFGGYDPYSNSKACSELVTAAYRNSYFHPQDYPQHRVAVASARAGNVIGGGDWATDRLLPDCFRALLEDDVVQIRNPGAIRPWQHVLEPLSGYLLLSQRLIEAGSQYAQGWNFGPADDDARPVGWIVERVCQMWDGKGRYELDPGEHPHEANYLKLDCSKARNRLQWRPRWSLEHSLLKIVEWTRAYRDGEDLRQASLDQIQSYESTEIE